MTDTEIGGHLGSVYGAKSPQELAAHYDDWSSTYDVEMANLGYRHPAIVLALLARHAPRGSAPVLDAGCGTGLVGEWLGIIGFDSVYGLDFSKGMLAKAARKKVYAKLTEAALGTTLPFETGYFAATVSSGVFTTGHVGAEGIDELVRITKPQGPIVLTIKDTLWEAALKAKIESLVAAGKISIAEQTEPYISMPGEPAASPTLAIVMKVSA